MKLLIAILAFAFGIICAVVLAVRHDDLNGKTTLNIAWDGPYALRVPGTRIISDAKNTKLLTINPPFESAFSSFNQTLFRIANPPVRCRFALEGTISYSNLPSDSALEMTACYVVKTVTVVTSENEGPEQSLYGSSDSRPFIMTMSETPGVGKLLQLELKAFIAGNPGEDLSKGPSPTITLSGLKLVSYPDPTPQELGLVPYGTTPTSGLLDWKSFSAGIAATAVLCLALAQAIVVVRRLHKLRAEREMRRISSLDG